MAKDVDTAKPEYTAPKGAQRSFKWGGKDYTVESDWIVLRKNEEPVAEMFFTAYLRKGAAAGSRPITFVFNGGPGAASAYLHVGALGPRRIHFEDDGGVPPPPVQLVDNDDSWLAFTDLVFVDPVGTGFSRTIKKPADKDAKDPKSTEENKDFYQITRDLESLGEFMQRCLSRFERWSSPAFIAGESYGGYRVAKLARKLQENYGIGLNGAILISPALEISLLFGSDYDLHHWVDVFPSFVASAWHHKKGIFAKKSMELSAALTLAESFATNELAKFYVGAGFMADKEKESVFKRYAELSGLDLDYVRRKDGRVSHVDYVRNLLKAEREVCGLYDASITAVDPYPDRDAYQGPEPTLFSIDRVFTSGVNSLLREWVGVKSERDYKLLNLEVNSAWQGDNKKDAFEPPNGATDDLRYGMSLNPHMKVFVTHGYFDLITPYFASNRLISLMKLTPEQRARLTVEHHAGGHMFYSWKKSRRDFTKSIAAFVKSALPK